MSVRLFLTSGVEERWGGVIEPWLEKGEAWREPRPTVLLTPSRALGFYLRGRWLESGRNLIGVRFWTPSDLRKFLLAHGEIEFGSASQTELRLLARLCAERLLADDRTVDRASIESVRREPDLFLHAYDLLAGAGWLPGRDGADYGRALADEFARACRRGKIGTQAEIHRRLRDAPGRGETPIARLLAVGFNATHWPLWDLLQAATRATEETEVALEAPRPPFGENVDQLWIGSWEDFAGVAYEIPEVVSSEEPPSGPRRLAQSYEQGTTDALREAEIDFVVGADVATQARALVLQTLAYLGERRDARIGLVFPSANALALTVTEQLVAFGLPVDDGIGMVQPGAAERRPWQTWLDLQEQPGAGHLIHWLRACEAAKLDSGLRGLSAGEAASMLDRARTETLVDDLEYLALHFAREKGAHHDLLADFLRRRVVLGPREAFATYVTLTREALRALAWSDLASTLPEAPPCWLGDDVMLARASFVAWLREATDSRTPARAGNHFYGRIHLLTYGQLEGQSWSHLILTGLNENVWPRFHEDGAFGSRHELAELNRRARSLNRRGTVQGRQGEGHEAVAPGHGYCLLPPERHDLSLRDLCAALAATRGSVCLAALTVSGERNLLPSDFFNHAWQVKTGRVLQDSEFRRLARLTADHVREQLHLFPTGATSPQDVATTGRAFAVRREASLPFGPYEFSYATPPAAPIQLSCKKWESALAHPESVWLSEIVGTSSWPESELKWPQAIGTWVHRWLAEALREAAPGELTAKLRRIALRDLKTVEERSAEAGTELSPWWRHVWAQARDTALSLGQRLAPELAGKKIVTELSLPNDIVAALPGCVEGDFALRGKIDLLLLEPASISLSKTNLDLAGCRAWVVDFKTGAAEKLETKTVAKGEGLQVALYGLALRARGASNPALSLLTPQEPLSRQITTDELETIPEIFQTLATMHRRGIFGQSPDGGGYAFSPAVPMTTRPVAAEILAAKWILTHPTLPEGETE